MTRPVWRTSACVLALTLLAGCGSGEETGGSRSEVTSVASAVSASAEAPSAVPGVPAPPPAEEWTTHTDPDSGLRFAMPGDPERPAEHNSTGQYGFKVSDELGLSVGSAETATAPHSADRLEEIADNVADDVRAAGVDDVVVADRQHTSIGARPVFDFRLSFTTPAGERTVWFARIIGDGTRTVQAQSIATVDPGAEAAVIPVVEAYQRLLVAGIRFP